MLFVGVIDESFVVFGTCVNRTLAMLVRSRGTVSVCEGQRGLSSPATTSAKHKSCFFAIE